jgi:hypothetical protein
MGWTSYNINTTATTGDILTREMSQDSANGTRTSWTVEQAATVGATWYAIMKRQPTDGPAIFYGLVVLTERRPIRGTGLTEFFYKDLSEECGPYECAMPARMLARLETLAPNPQGYAAKWREAVKQHHANKRAKAKAKKEARAELDRRADAAMTQTNHAGA